MASEHCDVDWILHSLQSAALANTPPSTFVDRNQGEAFSNRINHCWLLSTRSDQLVANYSTLIGLAGMRPCAKVKTVNTPAEPDYSDSSDSAPASATTSSSAKLSGCCRGHRSDNTCPHPPGRGGGSSIRPAAFLIVSSPASPPASASPTRRSRRTTLRSDSER